MFLYLNLLEETMTGENMGVKMQNFKIVLGKNDCVPPCQ